MPIRKALQGFVTPEIEAAAKDRFLNGGNLANADLSKTGKKIAVLLVLYVNKHETLTAGEAALVYGLTEPTLRKRQQPGDLPRRFNIGK